MDLEELMVSKWVLIVLFSHTCIGDCVALTTTKIEGFTKQEYCIEASRTFSDHATYCVEVK